MNIPRNTGFSWLLVLGLLAPTVFAQRPPPVRRAEAVAPEAAAPADGINVLILGDSLALCGFGKRLDDRFRKSPRVKATFTYLTCGTNPLSWLKERPYSNIKTHCGFVSIESTGPGHSRELQDVYGMRRGYTPRAHAVPKLEDLLTTVRPDILVMQTGTNLFDLFPDHKTVSPSRHGPALRSYLVPFITKAVSGSSTLRKIYWVASPTSGRVSKEVQDFVVQQTRADIGHIANVIDSRTLVPYPYRHMEPDKEHFIGEDMDLWADKVFDLVEQDLAQQPFAALKPLSEKGPPALAVIHEQPTPPAEKPKDDRPLQVKAKLISKTEPIPLNELLPYQEYLVGYVYEITKLIAGEYSESQILVMHPAYIGLKKQKLRYRVGKTYKLKLHELEETVWKTVKSRDDSGLINLQPYIQLRDETKHPEYAR
ncbi:MAG TPA: hypothetical protein VGW39_04530 [Chthoniobacterales bacterium]|nr:hypothetical protein [Chthoniobacterales bacterium]